MSSLDFGSYSRKVSTRVEEAQVLFDKGWNQMFGFNHEDAVRYFKKVLEVDSSLAIAHWAISHCDDLNYNNPEGLNRVEATKNAAVALELLENASDVEKSLIRACYARYPALKGQDKIASQPETIAANEIQYADAMREVYQKYPHDPDIAALFAESLMNLRPWKLWEVGEDGKVPAETFEIKKVLETALQEHPLHPGLLHFYIHLMELSPHPEEALDVANRLRDLTPDQGHLRHMPSHIDMWMGNYEDAIRANIEGIEADRRYVESSGIECEFYKMYRLHNVHFCCWACMFDGQYKNALKYARMMQEELTPELLNSKPGVEILEAFNCIVWHVFIRFGKWKEILEEPVPEDEKLYTMSIATAHYARGIAFASLGKITAAEAEKELFLQALENPLMPNRLVINNFAYKGNEGIFHIARFMLFGEIEYRKGNFTAAFEFLRCAVDFCDNIVYDEPWGWMIPPRHALGALLLEQEKFEEAATVYREDLKIHANNLWSIGGLIACLKQISDADTKEIQNLQCKLKYISARSDINVSASCFCSMSAGAVAPNKI